MTTQDQSTSSDWSDSLLQQLEEVENGRPIEDILPNVDEQERKERFRNLMARDLECRLKAGAIPHPSEYERRFPNYSRDVEEVYYEQVPRLPDKFKLECVVGKGRFGKVYLAHDQNIGRRVAIKVVSPQTDEPPDRLLEEAQKLGKLNDPGLVVVHEADRLDSTRVFIVMEYINGGTLGEGLQRGPISPIGAIDLLLPIIGAVQCAHNSGLIHRDLKPANILLTNDGKPKVADFGMAIVSENAVTGEFAGTPSYMAPEQIRAEKPSSLWDVWAIGVILYEMLTGKRPFDGSTEELRRAIESQDPQFPSALWPHEYGDEVLDGICLRCLKKNPKARYNSAQELGEALRNWRDNRPNYVERALLLLGNHSYQLEWVVHHQFLTDDDPNEAPWPPEVPKRPLLHVGEINTALQEIVPHFGSSVRDNADKLRELANKAWDSFERSWHTKEHDELLSAFRECEPERHWDALNEVSPLRQKPWKDFRGALASFGRGLPNGFKILPRIGYLFAQVLYGKYVKEDLPEISKLGDQHPGPKLRQTLIRLRDAFPEDLQALLTNLDDQKLDEELWKAILNHFTNPRPLRNIRRSAQINVDIAAETSDVS